MEVSGPGDFPGTFLLYRKLLSGRVKNAPRGCARHILRYWLET